MTNGLREFDVAGFLVVAHSPESAASAVMHFVDRAAEAGLGVTPHGIVSAFPIGDPQDLGPSPAYDDDFYDAVMLELAKSHT